MSPLATLPVSTGTMLALMRYLEQTAADLDLCGIADDAIIDWLNRRRAESERTARPVLHGYQWKSLFLPEGTRLRRWSCSTQDYAEVIGDDLIHEGLPTSPNRFVAACAGSVRNAWQEISVLMPGATTWKFASNLRREIEAAAKRALDGTALTQQEASPPAADLPVIVRGGRPPPPLYEGEINRIPAITYGAEPPAAAPHDRRRPQPRERRQLQAPFDRRD